MTLGVATVFEALGQTGAAVQGIQPLWKPIKLAGPVFTVRAAHNDNLALHRAIAEAPPGTVIVAATDVSDVAVWGEIMTAAAQERRLLGLVTDGAVRDAARIQEMRFPVFCAHVSPVGAVKSSPGELGGTVSLGGVTISAQDWIVGDDDGLVAVEKNLLEPVVTKAQLRRRRETEMLGRLRHGELTIDLLGLRGLLT
jgi:4-hydroxy-4-methyl-2-oxoglutarate aldolase